MLWSIFYNSKAKLNFNVMLLLHFLSPTCKQPWLILHVVVLLIPHSNNLPSKGRLRGILITQQSQTQKQRQKLHNSKKVYTNILSLGASTRLGLFALKYVSFSFVFPWYHFKSSQSRAYYEHNYVCIAFYCRQLIFIPNSANNS